MEHQFEDLRFSHAPGYINKDLEKIVGLQTDAPLKRAIMPLVVLKWWKVHVKFTVVN